MNSKLTLGAAGALLALIASSASAAVIVNYSMTAAPSPNTGTTSLAPTSTIANVTASSLILSGTSSTAPYGGLGGATITTSNDNWRPASTGTGDGTDRVLQFNTGSPNATATYAATFTAANYFQFSVTASDGYQITLDTLSFQAGAATTNTAAIRSAYLVSATSTAGFNSSLTPLYTVKTAQAVTASGVAGDALLTLRSATASQTNPSEYSASISSLATIAPGETRYFRFYLQTETSSQGIAFDDIVINGTVSEVSAIPEPSSFAALAGLGALGFVAARRRRA